MGSTPEHILDAWTALEVLSPPTFRRPEDLVAGDRTRLASLEDIRLPWEGGGEKPRPKTKLYYQVVLGSVSLAPAFTELLASFADTRLEHPAAWGEAILGVITLNQEGRLVEAPAVSVSSFAWGLPLALRRDLTSLSNWSAAESKLLEELDDRLRRARPGEPDPALDRATLETGFDWLVNRLGLLSKLVKPPRFAIRCYTSAESPEPLLLNSFFLHDLRKTKDLFKKGRPTRNLRRFLGVETPEHRADLLDNRAAIEAAVAPYRIPPARWPGPGRHSLVLLQQAAVNLALGDLREGGILAVNGPPGTGKTTLLRDLVAAIVALRAEAMARFDDPADAFSASGEKLTSGAASLHLYRLDKKLKGFEIVVASSNNKAVENVSAALPALDAIAEDAQGLRYLKTLSDALLGRETWGLGAAVLGNMTNRARFRNTFWWDKDVGLSTYLAEAAGTPQWIDIVDAKTGETTARPPRIVTEENPPKSHEEALGRWGKARAAFRTAHQRSSEALKELEEVRAKAAKGGPASTAWWRTAGRRAVEAARERLGDRFLDAEFFARSHEARQMTVPWLDEEQQRLRDEVFVAAIQLHRAFLDAATKPLRHNLGALMNVFGGRRLPTPEKQALVPDLWASLFLVVPLVSTTFASVERMLGDLPPEALGWLFIDEAGQALPQAAVGALLRTRRAVVVGDPVQIEPIVILPDKLTHAICQHFDVDPNRWNAPAASAQTLADAATPYMASFEGRFGSREVGVPLLVHRRCSEPMFGISNAVAYERLMVQAKRPGGSPIGDLLGPSSWFDVKGSSVDKWCAEEGEVVLGLLRRLAEADVEPNLYIVSPFVLVAQNLRTIIRESRLPSRWIADLRAWTNERVGTVHTVQGREAEAVLFVLGAPAAQQAGARNWAGGRPNLLNVAVTRAKERLYVVGNRTLWREAGLFRELDQRMGRS
ncbi:MAG TPA: ATP-binding protein [Thermoanaerobaculia bacterium]|jgi:hypothetical protein|nr:ATP-binding protein [Thermoanaerobaculia bacterium]